MFYRNFLLLSLMTMTIALLTSMTACVKQKQSHYEEKWGIEVESIRLSAGGYMIDFRYRVLDPEKADYLADHTLKPYLEDIATGAKMIVPAPAKVGALRNTNRRGSVERGRTYYIIFANPGRYIKPGSKVNVVIGDFVAKNLTLQ